MKHRGNTPHRLANLHTNENWWKRKYSASSPAIRADNSLIRVSELNMSSEYVTLSFIKLRLLLSSNKTEMVH